MFTKYKYGLRGRHVAYGKRLEPWTTDKWRVVKTGCWRKVLTRLCPLCTATAIPIIYSFPGNSAASAPVHIQVSVSDLYIISPHISSSRKGRPPVRIYNSLTDTWMWKLWLRPRYSFSGNICFKFSALCLCSVGPNGGRSASASDYFTMYVSQSNN